jgi:hypothetical protein
MHRYSILHCWESHRFPNTVWRAAYIRYDAAGIERIEGSGHAYKITHPTPAITDHLLYSWKIFTNWAAKQAKQCDVMRTANVSQQKRQ